MVSQVLPILRGTYRYASRIGKVVPDLLMGSNGMTSEALGQVIRDEYVASGSAVRGLQAGWHTLETSSNASGLGFFGKIRAGGADCWQAIRSGFSNMGANFSTGAEAAKAAGANGVWGGIKAAAGGFSKAMPFICTALLALEEIPNIYTACKEKGLWQGLKETGKSVAKLSGAAAGAAIGSAICPGIGSVIGWFAGSWLTSKVVGSSYTQQKQERQELLAQAQQEALEQQQQQYVAQLQQAPQNPPVTTAGSSRVSTSNPFDDMLLQTKYSDDFLLNNGGVV